MRRRIVESWHRFYDPTTGRYITADPIGLAGGMNLYAYVRGDPVNLVDPWGLREKLGAPTLTPPDDCSGPCLDPYDRYREGRWVWHAPYGDDCGYCLCVSDNWYWDDELGYWVYNDPGSPDPKPKPKRKPGPFSGKCCSEVPPLPWGVPPDCDRSC